MAEIFFFLLRFFDFSICFSIFFTIYFFNLFFVSLVETTEQVTDANGKICGLLDIAKCLYDAVHRLEKAAAKKADGDDGGDGGGGGDDSTVMLGAVMEAAKAMKGKANSAKHQNALQARRPISFFVIFVYSCLFLSNFVFYDVLHSYCSSCFFGLFFVLVVVHFFVIFFCWVKFVRLRVGLCFSRIGLG